MLIGKLEPTGRTLNKPKGDVFTADSWLENDGDGVDQEAAHARGTMDRNTGEIPVGKSLIKYDLSKETNERELCRNSDLVIASRIEKPLPCAAVTLKSLRKSGSIAIWKEGESFRVETTNARRGARVWIP